MLKEFRDWLISQNWQIEQSDAPLSIPEDVLERYPGLPNSWLSFASGLKKCEDKTGNKWFLVAPDFLPKGPDDWFWNEFELMGLDASKGDAKWTQEVTDFWATHFPIYLAVDPEYEYYAIDMEEGSVIYGHEPDFEEKTRRVASSFPEFLSKVISGTLKL